MMPFIFQLAGQRKKFLEGLDANEGDINLDIFEDFYPDKAHFVFELLQNAEDAGATEVTFTLTREHCLFEHNGKRAFNEADVRAITGIHNSTKSKAQDQIGKFGIGFKSVFVYTLTPVIHSKNISFSISRLVLPEPMEIEVGIGDRTRFEFPFNNPKKSPQDAFEEIKAGLEELEETTLLFLSNIESIRWQIGKQVEGEVLRIEHTKHHLEVLKQIDGKTTASSHFLCFSKPVEGLEKHQRIAVAFDLDYLPKVTAYDHKKTLSDQLKIVPASPGRVAVFFPAEKETSGLRFHLHAPFVPELSRASIKETPANEPLYRQLARLAAEALHRIRDMKLLGGEFLGVLPNPQDVIPARYQAIRTAIIDEMKNKALTPTYSKSHAPAKHLLQAKASLKDLLTEADIKFLVDYDEEPPQWAISASLKNSDQDRFLTGLEITSWDINEFVQLLIKQLRDGVFCKPDENFMKWLATKPLDWHQRLYSLLYKELSVNYGLLPLKQLQVVRLSTGAYSCADKCYFPSNETEDEELLSRVARGVYTSGKSNQQQEDAKKFLEEIGVHEASETEEVKAILEQRYTLEAKVPNKKTYWKDLERFITLVDKEGASSNLFEDYFIFERDSADWATPCQVYLDLPYLETGLSNYYKAFDEEVPRGALSPIYQKSKIPLDKLLKFAKAVGVQTFVDETEQVETILEQRYTDEGFNPDIMDMKRFIALVEKEPLQSKIFADYSIFKMVDGNFGEPSQVYLDLPYLETGMSAYYNAFGKNSPRSAMAEDYEKLEIPLDKLRKFAEAVGVQIKLEVVETKCHENPNWTYLSSVPGERWTSSINKDYVIPGLMLSWPTIELSKLVWETMCSLPHYPSPYRATYQKNETNGAHYADSQLVHQLKISAWVPQRDGTFVLPSEALRDELPQGFPFDVGYEWLKKIDFGKNAHKKSEEQCKKQEIAKELGFVDEQSLSDGKWFAGLDPEERQKIQDDVERRQQVELPDNSPRNPDRRAELIGQQAVDAPERTTEKRMRSVSIGREDVKQEAAQYLIEQYTNPSGIMFCQICKAELPFRLNNRNYYFEKVDFLPGLQKRHYQNYLALCPNHSAMFQHTNGLTDRMRDMFAKIEENEQLEVVLAQQNMTVYFTETHRLDLQAVVRVELKEEG